MPPPFPLEEEEKGLPEDWKTRLIPTKYLVAAGSLALVLLFFVLSLFSLLKPEKVEIVKKDTTKVIQEAVDKFSDVQFSYNPAMGKLFLVGHVLTTVDHQELLYNLHTLPFMKQIDDNIVIDELVWKNINSVLV